MILAILAQTEVRFPAPTPQANFSVEGVIAITAAYIFLSVIGLALIVAITKRKMQRDDMEATLKMEMIERGMSAEDIERVLAARMGPSGHGCKHRGFGRERRDFQPQERG